MKVSKRLKTFVNFISDSWEWFNNQQGLVQALIVLMIICFVVLPLASLVSKIMGYGW